YSSHYTLHYLLNRTPRDAPRSDTRHPCLPNYFYCTTAVAWLRPCLRRFASLCLCDASGFVPVKKQESLGLSPPDRQPPPK
ncbi:hypothetical protein V5799_024646, partial [Amblyomma americanum]